MPPNYIGDSASEIESDAEEEEEETKRKVAREESPVGSFDSIDSDYYLGRSTTAQILALVTEEPNSDEADEEMSPSVKKPKKKKAPATKKPKKATPAPKKPKKKATPAPKKPKKKSADVGGVKKTLGKAKASKKVTKQKRELKLKAVTIYMPRD